MSIAHPSVKITDSTHSLVLGNGVVQATPSLTLINVLYVPQFSVGLLSISQLTKQNNLQNNIFPFSLCVDWEEDLFGA